MRWQSQPRRPRSPRQPVPRNLAEPTAGSQVAPPGAFPAAPMGFFTDTTICIGCKACEVACKNWNGLSADVFTLSGDSYDNTRELSGETWRHVQFIEQFPRRIASAAAG